MGGTICAPDVPEFGLFVVNRFDAPSSETRIQVEYGEIELNPSWEAKDFSLPPPRGAVIVPLH